MTDKLRDALDTIMKPGFGQTEPIEGTISHWMPTQNRHDLAVLGKLIEELSECSARAARCIIHGVNETDPDSGRTNMEELRREVSDVLACIDILEMKGVDRDIGRMAGKVRGFHRWHQMIRDEEARNVHDR